jgi:long-subunit fatty acid transport protein
VSTTVTTEIKDRYSQFRGINANFGLFWHISKLFTLGAVVKTPFEASLKHEFNFRQTQTFGSPVDTTVANTQSITEDVDLDMPLQYGLGLACRISDTFTIDLDVYRTHWSDFILTDSRGNKFSPIDGRPENESDVDDTTQVRLGGEYLFVLQEKEIIVPLRGGFFYDPEPSEGGTRDFFGFSVGSGIAYKRFIFDAAYQFRWGNNVDTGNLIATSEADIYQHTILASIILHF